MIDLKHLARYLSIAALALSLVLLASTPVLAAPDQAPAAEPAKANGLVATKVKYVEALTNLNVRSGPGYNYRTVGAVRSGEIAAVIGVSADRGWWQIRCYWSSACWLIARSDLTRPVPGPYSGPIPYYETDVKYVRALGEVNIRSGPSTNYQVIGRLGRFEIIAVTGISLDATWWRVACSRGSDGNCFVARYLTRPESPPR